MAFTSGAISDAQHVQEIVEFAKRFSSEQDRNQQFREAFTAFGNALRQTIDYLAQLDKGATYDQSTERNISELWWKAAQAIAPFDADLANRCVVKGDGWLDPKMWNDPQFKDKISIQQMRKDFMNWNQAQKRSTVPDWFPKAGVAFAALTFLSLFYLVIGPELQQGKKVIFDIWMAFCLACSLAFLGGDAAAKGKIKPPFFRDSPIQFSTTGGIAVFVIVFLILYGACH